MYNRYAAQWSVSSFREVVASVPQLALLWDDHDFAWNNACGSTASSKRAVSSDVQRISRTLFLQFKEHLEARDSTLAYPSMPAFAPGVDPGQDIKYCFDRDFVRFIMTDGRTYREEADHEGAEGEPSSNLLGEAQRAWVKQKIDEWPGVRLLASGSVLVQSPDSWDHYVDYGWLLEQRFPKTVVLSGDIHSNRIKWHSSGESYNLLEVTASGAARPHWGGDSGNFGILDVEPDSVHVMLFEKSGMERQGTYSL
jgi:alkaline phosphatase D